MLLLNVFCVHSADKFDMPISLRTSRDPDLTYLKIPTRQTGKNQHEQLKREKNHELTAKVEAMPGDRIFAQAYVLTPGTVVGFLGVWAISWHRVMIFFQSGWCVCWWLKCFS